MKTLDDIVPPSRRAPAQRARAERPTEPPRRARFPYTTAIVALIVVVLAVVVLFYFSGAVVEATPNTATITVSGSYTATPSGDLPFTVVSAQKVATENVPATGTQTVTSVAKGTITIYNTQKVAQKLIATTRFETPAGLVFHIKSGVTVPAGGAVNPGSVTAAVYADQPGAEYNIGPSTFTVPGLQKTPQYNQVSAKSSAAMTGGASGTVPSVDPSVATTARAALVAALAPDLESALAAQVPAGYVLLAGAATTSYADLAPAPGASSGTADLKESGTITAVVFPSVALAKAIATTVEGASYDGEAQTIQNPSDISLTSAAPLPGTSAQSFSFSLSGTANLLSTIDPVRIASAVAGKTRAAAQVALTSFPEIKQAVLILRPFWRSTFPQDPASIKVVVEKPS